MTILNDAAIRDHMSRNELILNGDPLLARFCSYDFRAARVVFGGAEPPTFQIASVDLTGTQKTAVIMPSAVAWVRSHERVKIPRNVVGLWMQTNSLSRSGLLLLNSTLVEPGYEGFLSAHFVNFGASPMTLSATTTIAKLVFIRLDANSLELVDSAPFEHYDSLIDSLAAQSTKSFLRINEVTSDLGKAMNDSIENARKEITEQTDESVKDAKERLLSIERKTFVRIGSGFVLGLTLASAFALWIYPRLRDLDNESRERIRAIVTEQNATLVKRLEGIQSDIKAIKSEGNSSKDTSSDLKSAQRPQT